MILMYASISIQTAKVLKKMQIKMFLAQKCNLDLTIVSFLPLHTRQSRAK